MKTGTKAASSPEPEPEPESGPGSGLLPVADPRRARRAAFGLIKADGRAFTVVVLLNALAAAAGLVGPWLLGRIVDTVKRGGTVADVDRLAVTMLVCSLAQLLLSRYARYAGHRFGERTSARIREQFVDRVLALPASAAERGGTGDLTARGTNDIATVGTTLRDAGPEVSMAMVQVLFVLGAAFALDPILGGIGVVALLGIWFAARWYLRRAHPAYLAEGAADSALAEVLVTTAAGARTVEALGLQERRVAACVAAIERVRSAQHRTLFLRSVLFPAIDVSQVLPVVAVLMAGSALLEQKAVSLGTVVAMAMYFRQLSTPMDTVLLWMEQLQGSGASFARIEGVGLVARERRTDADAPTPADDRIEVRDVRYAYDGGGEDVLHGVDFSVRPGERIAVVGPSGAGKTTLGRLLAGVDEPRTGAVTVGGVPVATLAPDRLRRQIVLVTQEHHVFAGTVRDNLLLAAPAATDDELRQALAVVGAEWAAGLPDGLDTQVGADGHRIDGAQAQQLALARVVLADPHTLILDEATALLDPTTARHTERALAAVLEGRTVIAIAHRLHTAHDADRVAVMADGRLTELGTHDELVAHGGAYARLWSSWHGGS